MEWMTRNTESGYGAWRSELHREGRALVDTGCFTVRLRNSQMRLGNAQMLQEARRMSILHLRPRNRFTAEFYHARIANKILLKPKGWEGD